MSNASSTNSMTRIRERLDRRVDTILTLIDRTLDTTTEAAR